MGPAFTCEIVVLKKCKYKRSVKCVRVLLHLYGNTALQLELQLNHVDLLAGAELAQLGCARLHLVHGHVQRLQLRLLLTNHLHALLHVGEGAGSWGGGGESVF